MGRPTSLTCRVFKSSKKEEKTVRLRAQQMVRQQWRENKRFSPQRKRCRPPIERNRHPTEKKKVGPPTEKNRFAFQQRIRQPGKVEKGSSNRKRAYPPAAREKMPTSSGVPHCSSGEKRKIANREKRFSQQQEKQFAHQQRSSILQQRREKNISPPAVDQKHKFRLPPEKMFAFHQPKKVFSHVDVNWFFLCKPYVTRIR